MPETTPTPAQRVARTLQHAHHRAELEREQAAEQLRHLTEQHARAVAALADAHAQEQALAAALAEAGGRPWREEQDAQREAARAEREARMAERAALVEQAREQAGPEATPAAVVATARRVGIAQTGHRPERAEPERAQHRPLDAPRPGEEPWHCQECGGPCEEVADMDEAPAPVQAGTLAAVLARTLADPTSTAATRAAAAQAAQGTEEPPPVPAPVQAGTVAAVDTHHLAGPIGRPREV